MRKLARQYRAMLAALYTVVGAALFLFTSLQQAARAEDADANSEVLQKVRAAWDHRRDAVKTLQCEFTLHRATEKCWADPVETRNFKPRVPTGEIVESDRTYHFSMDGKKLALVDEGKAIDSGGNSWKPAKTRLTFDGMVNRRFSESPGRPTPVTERKANEPDDCLTRDIHLAAIWMSFSTDRALAHKTAEFTVSSANKFHDGRECIELARPRGPESRELITVDPSLDYLPVRYRTERQGKTGLDLRIQYVADTVIGWRISRWDAQMFRDGSFMETSMGIVTGFSVNKPLPDDLFTIEAPEGVEVEKLQ